MRKVELLAPAGSADAGFAALEYGADAIYLGLPQFSARAEAVNFTIEEFYNIVGYAHSLDRRVYVTLNTLIKERELPAVIKMLCKIEQAQADALIVQDLGVVRLLREYFPSLRIHASTQMAIHNRAGAEYLLNMGIKRVTLARELSFGEIADISAIAGLETESFLHGALCYSYSGLCMYSSMHSGRSANRGRCAYSCREVFRQPELNLHGHAFSLRDLELSGNIADLLTTGVDSLKIEGRKKSPLYVAAVVRLYRQLLDRSCSPQELEAYSRDVQTIFSRQTCTYFTAGEKDAASRAESLDTDAVGHRGTVIGRAEKLSRKGKDITLTFTAALPFEKHDGLQIDDPRQERPFGFPVTELFKVFPDGKKKAVFEIQPAELAEITMPEDTPLHLQGELLYLSSSQRLKRELKWRTPKADEFSRRYNIAVTLRLEASSLTAEAAVTDEIPDTEIISAVHTYQHEKAFDNAKNPQQTSQGLQNNFGKTGSTPFTLQQFTLTGSEDLFIPASLSNSIRRQLYELLAEKLRSALTRRTEQLSQEIPDKEQHTAPTQQEHTAPYWIIRLDSQNPLATLAAIEQPTLNRLAEIIIELSPGTDSAVLAGELTDFKNSHPAILLRLALPAVARSSEEKLLHSKAAELISRGFTHWQISNLWGLGILRQFNGLTITGGTQLYALNTLSIREQLKLGLSRASFSVEDELENLQPLLAAQRNSVTLPVYQDIPLFIGEACSYSGFNQGCPADCQERNSSRIWYDRYHKSYLLRKDNCRTILCSGQAYSLSGKIGMLENPYYLEIDFINRSYSAREMQEVITAIFADQRIPDTHTGNFLRKLQ